MTVIKTRICHHDIPRSRQRAEFSRSAAVATGGVVAPLTFDLSPEIITAIKDGRVAFAVDQQQYLQGYLPVVALDLYKRYGLLPANDVLSGPGFVTKENADQVAKLAGTVR